MSFQAKTSEHPGHPPSSQEQVCLDILLANATSQAASSLDGSVGKGAQTDIPYPPVLPLFGK